MTYNLKRREYTNRNSGRPRVAPLLTCISGDIDLQHICKFGVNIHLEYNTGDNFILMGCVIAGYLFSVEPFLCMPANNAMCISQLKITDMSKIF